MVKGAIPANKDEAIRLLRDTKMKYGEIEALTGIPYGTIAGYAKAHRPKSVRKQIAAENYVPKKGMMPEGKGDTDKAVQLLAEGKYSYAEIHKMSGVPQGSLTRLSRLYKSGQYKWVGEPMKTVEIEVPSHTPENKEEVEIKVEKLESPAPTVNIAEAVEEFKREMKAEFEAEMRAKIEAEVRAEMTVNSNAEQTSEVGTIQKFLTFKYNASGEKVSSADFIAELNEFIATLEASGNEIVTFTLNVEAE
jgi:uncharacterized protein YerC